MVTKVVKRDGQVVFCDGQKIADAIAKAAAATGENIDSAAIAHEILIQLSLKEETQVGVETIQDMVEQALIRIGAADTAKAYILYRENRRKVREGRLLIDTTSRLFHDYLDDKDWMIQENANTRKSINGMNNYIREA
ncbi:MAG: ribonucleoside triphosphate reductase, partial [Spirochaetales bacterium]|nr:ribonucleoside triphosphate reductase [Spirochaetales bacterium]